jgi:Undecaprenyl-phosphate galactose phosphotransferase WbaP
MDRDCQISAVPGFDVSGLIRPGVVSRSADAPRGGNAPGVLFGLRRIPDLGDDGVLVAHGRRIFPGGVSDGMGCELAGNSSFAPCDALLVSKQNLVRIARKLRSGMLGVRVAGVFSENQILTWARDMPPVLGDLSAAPDVAGARVAQYAIVAIDSKSNVELGWVIEDYCRGFRHVLLVPDMPGVCSLGVTARDIDGELGLELPQKLFHRRSALAKRVMDCGLSLILVVILAPLFALIAAAIKLTSKGPVFYGHLRYGLQGEKFRALKFRTMVVDADRILADYLVSHAEYTPEWQRNHKLKSDPRITRVGKWLRRASLDELPQLINVLRGQMSLVGPRPIVKDEIQKYGRGYGLYTRVIPGITGLWQVSGRNNTTYEERVAYDEHYVHNWSVWLDLYILVRTIKTVVTAEGAY